MKDSVLGKAREGEPNRYERDTRGYVVLRPATVTAVKPAPTPAPAPVRYTPPPAPKVEAPKKNCDPPYTIDPATGRKKYKLECLK